MGLFGKWTMRPGVVSSLVGSHFGVEGGIVNVPICLFDYLAHAARGVQDRHFEHYVGMNISLVSFLLYSSLSSFPTSPLFSSPFTHGTPFVLVTQDHND